MVGGVLEVDNEWDICTELIYRIMQDFPGVQPIQPKVSLFLLPLCPAYMNGAVVLGIVLLRTVLSCYFSIETRYC